jgi:CTP synthase (UTP-ammonia lyase)
LLIDYDGIWCVPASPYANTGAALSAIRFAREQDRPFLGTCGGFQHALLEFAQNVLGMPQVSHSEIDPAASDPLIAPLDCSLVEQTAEVFLAPDSKIAAAYGQTKIAEGYHCRYGLSRKFERIFEKSDLHAVGWDSNREVRAVEHGQHRFFVATLFQPERAALRKETPPLVRAFLESASAV